MDGLVIGIDLCNEYTQINCAEDEVTWTIPTVICKNKNTDEWYVGEEAYAHTLKGDGIIVDKLVKLVLKEGTATLGEIRYEGKELLKLFLEKTLAFPKEHYASEEILRIVFTVRSLEERLLLAIYDCAETLGVKREQIYIMSHSESFGYYIMSQKKEIWNGVVGMFDLAEERLCYYELKVQRNMKKTTVLTEYENLEEGFNLDILETPSGAKLADKILCSCGERMMQKKSYSSVFLMGKGFWTQDWAKEFMKQVCNRRKGYIETALFAKGAAYRALDLLQEKTSYPYVFLCDGRLRSTVSMYVQRKGQETSIVIASAGERWYDREIDVDVIPDGQETIDFIVSPPDCRNQKKVSIPLEGFPKRPKRTTKVQIQIRFLDDHTMRVQLNDKGFGELFPSSGIQIRQEVML